MSLTYVNGRVATVSLPNGVSRTFSYDPAGRASGMTQSLPGLTAESFTYSYDSENRLIGIVSNAGWQQSFIYDAAGRLARETRTGPDGHDKTYRYDGNDNRTYMGVRTGSSLTPHTLDFEAADWPA